MKKNDDNSLVVKGFVKSEVEFSVTGRAICNLHKAIKTGKNDWKVQKVFVMTYTDNIDDRMNHDHIELNLRQVKQLKKICENFIKEKN